MKPFEKTRIKNLELKNRFIMAAANDNCDEKTRIKRYNKLAKGEVGLIISGGQTLSEIKSWKNVISSVHENGGKIAIQIVNDIGGKFGKDEDVISVSTLDENNVFFKNPYVKFSKHHQATDEEIEKIISSYVDSAILAKKLGADGIEIHSANQSFLMQFLSPLMNFRKDKWGGNLENRTRIHKSIIEAIRDELGDDYPVIIKLGMEDSFERGLKFEDGKKLAKLICSYGYDAIEISQGLQDLNNFSKTPMRIGINKLEDEAYFKNWSIEVKKLIDIPVILTGGLRSYELIDSVLENNEADCIGLCRPLIREPGLVKRWKNQDYRKATCISCNKCITEVLLKGHSLECYLDK
jgi:2,4-dienoyl-CoA reductase-like NADH-dependent reductase (Old Yellow Enzyme family)